MPQTYNIVNDDIDKYFNIVHFVIQKILKFPNNYEDYENIFQEGCIGLYEAYNKYEQGNVKFVTFAIIYIRGNILKYFREYVNNPYGIRLSRSLKEQVNKYKALTDKEQYPKEIENMDLDKIYEIRNMKRNSISLNQPVTETVDNDLDYGGMSLSGLYEEDIQDKIHKNIELEEKLKMLDNILTEEMRIIVIERLKNKTQQDVGKILGLSTMSIYRREKTIFKLIEDINKSYEQNKPYPQNKEENRKIKYSIYEYVKQAYQ